MHLDDLPYTSEQHSKLQKVMNDIYAEFGEPIRPEWSVCERRLKVIEEGLTDGECWWLVNSKSGEVTWSCGVKEALGYSNKITFYDTVNWIHGKYRSLFIKYNTQVVKAINETLKGKFQHMKQRYVVDLPVKHQQGHYIQATRTSYAFQFDENNNLVSHLHRLFLHINHNEPRFEMSLLDLNSVKLEAAEKQIRQRVLQMSALPFSQRQMEILKYYANEQATKAEDISRLLDIKLSTVYKHQTNILGLAKENASNKFPSLKDAATYYRSRRLI